MASLEHQVSFSWQISFDSNSDFSFSRRDNLISLIFRFNSDDITISVVHYTGPGLCKIKQSFNKEITGFQSKSKTSLGKVIFSMISAQFTRVCFSCSCSD